MEIFLKVTLGFLSVAFILFIIWFFLKQSSHKKAADVVEKVIDSSLNSFP